MFSEEREERIEELKYKLDCTTNKYKRKCIKQQIRDLRDTMFSDDFRYMMEYNRDVDYRRC